MPGRLVVICMAIVLGGWGNCLAELYSPHQRFGITYDYNAVKKSFGSFDITPFMSIGWYADGRDDYPDCSGPIARDDNFISRVITIGTDSSKISPDTIHNITHDRQNWFRLQGKYTTYWQIANRVGYDCYTRRLYSYSPRYYMITNYVRNFHDLSHQIKSASRNSKIGFGLISMSIERDISYNNLAFLQYALRQYYRTYKSPMDVDVFNLEIIFHDVSDASINHFKQSIRYFRNIIANIELANNTYHSYRNSELWVRIGIDNLSLSSNQIIELMGQTLNWLDSKNDNFDMALGLADDNYRLVQRWSWHPLTEYSGKYINSALYNSAGELTNIGIAYSSFVPSHCPEPCSLILLTIAFTALLLKRRVTNIQT